MIRFSKGFDNSETRTTFKAALDQSGSVPAAKIAIKG
jgi:hypothetical protein